MGGGRFADCESELWKYPGKDTRTVLERLRASTDEPQKLEQVVPPGSALCISWRNSAVRSMVFCQTAWAVQQ